MHDAVTLDIGATPPDAMIIWLHGLGSDGNDFVSAVPALHLPSTARVWCVFPHAHHRSITIQGGRWMPGWYDIQTARFWSEEPVGIEASISRIRLWIQRGIEAGIDTSRIIIAGFSQGGALALCTALSHSQPLGGIVVLSSYMPLGYRFQLAPENYTTPIWMAHGHHDPLIPLAAAQHSCAHLRKQGYQVEWHDYPTLAHNVSDAELKTLGQWLQKRWA